MKLKHIYIQMTEPESDNLIINADLHPDEANEAIKQCLKDDETTIKENKKNTELSIKRIEKELCECDKMIFEEISFKNVANIKLLIIDRESVLKEFIPEKTDFNFCRYERAIEKCNRLKEKTDCKLIELKSVGISNIRTLKEPLIFAGLFKPEYRDKLNIFFERLQSNGYIDENNNWIIKSETNEPAKLFHFLKDRNVIIAPKFAPAIKCFYNEFGCEVVEKVNGNQRATTRKNTEVAINSIDESAFKFLFSWISKDL